MIAIRFEIRLQEPLLTTAIEGDPNSAVSLPYIPGSLIRGVLASRYLQSSSTADLAVDALARQLFFNDETRYLNAYPAAGGGDRSLPTPAGWYKEKGAGDKFTAYDLSVADLDDTGLDHPVRVEKPFCTLEEEEEAIFYEPSKQITVHTQRDRVMGRATEGSGAVFQYEALAPDQVFIGLALCPDQNAADTVERLLQEKNVLLGGSRSAGYGLAEIRNVQRMENWIEAPNQEIEAIPTGANLALTLLSDAILRDANGHYTGFLAPEALAPRLGVPLTLVNEYTFARSGVVGGFNRKWGLPLPQAPVARAGSVYTFQAQGDIPAARLQSLLDEGVGERLGEGFGRLALHWNQAEAVQATEPVPRSLLPVTLDDSGQSARLARRMATRMLRRRLDAQLTERITRLHIKGEIRNSQLSNIRTLVRSAWLNRDVQPILQHLQDLKDTARKQVEAARVDGDSLDIWITGLVEASPDGVWARLYHTDLDANALPAVGGIRAGWDEKLAREYALRLIDGVLGRTLEKRRAER